MYSRPMVPDEFVVPQTFQTKEFILEPLTVKNLIKDYDAVMSSVKHLKGLMDNEDDWPIGLTIEENLVDLGWHQREFTLRHSFAYSVLSLSKNLYLGCCYIYPTKESEYGAQSFYWIREQYLFDGLEIRLGLAFKTWLETDWPFSSIDFPGRN